MKKHLVIATGLALLSTSAWATKARMEALGQSSATGSYFLSDSRNVFYNPAELNGMKDYTIFEWGSSVSTAGADFADGANTPKSEGGFFKTVGNFAFGAYLGRDSNDLERNNKYGVAYAATDAGYGAPAALTSLSTGETGFLVIGNNVDLFFAGDMGVEWGAHITYAANKDEGSVAASGINREQSALGVDLGVVMGDLKAWANADLKDESTGGSTTNDKWEADLGLDLGASYMFQGYTAYANYTKGGFEYTNGGALTTAGEMSKISAGVARVHDVSSTARWFWDLNWYTQSYELTSKASGNSAKGERKIMTTPLTIGFEADATSWLVLRGYVKQSLMGNIEDTVTNAAGTAQAYNGKKYKSTNTADVGAGATLNFGKLKVDGSIGTFDSTIPGTPAEKGYLTLDNLMSRVSVHYWF